MRVFPRVSSVVVALWIVSPPAQAGYIYDSPLCVAPLDVVNHYSDVSSDFAGKVRCAALCKRAYGDCRELVARSKSCLKATIADTTFYSKNEVCEEIAEPASRRVCKADYNATAATWLLDVNAQARSAGVFCGEVRDTCLASCNPT